MKITVDLTDSQTKTLQELAAAYGIEPDVLFRSAVRGLFSSDWQQFESAAQYVLNKNDELLERLSK